jgi:hypothetical protein
MNNQHTQTKKNSSTENIGIFVPNVETTGVGCAHIPMTHIRDPVIHLAPPVQTTECPIIPTIQICIIDALNPQHLLMTYHDPTSVPTADPDPGLPAISLHMISMVPHVDTFLGVDLLPQHQSQNSPY